MTDNIFYLFFYDSPLKDLLLGEIALKYPELHLSFSNKSFISMKGPSGFEEKLKKNPIIFAKRQALFLSKEQTEPTNSSFIRVSENQFWLYQTIETPIDTYDLQSVELPKEAPARAYLKIQEAHSLFNLDFKNGQIAVEIGSAPGGISYYLLKQGMKLYCIDPAKMEPALAQNFPTNFRHIMRSVFDVDRRDLYKDCNWLISDLNLEGRLNIEQSKRIMDYYPELQGAFLTIKTPKISDLNKIPLWIKFFEPDYEVTAFHLPSHRREIGFMIKPLKKNLP